MKHKQKLFDFLMECYEGNRDFHYYCSLLWELAEVAGDCDLSREEIKEWAQTQQFDFLINEDNNSSPVPFWKRGIYERVTTND